MTLSSISPITLEGQPQELSSFTRAGVLYVLWHTAISDIGLKRLHWKPHTGLDFTEVTPALSVNFRNVTAVLQPSTDQLLVVWDDGTAVSGSVDGNIVSARFNVLTGALISGPTVLFPGSQAKVSYRTVPGNQLALYYVTVKSGGVYGRLSLDGGVTWQSGEPLITNQVLGTTKVEVVPYDSEHVSIAQLGSDPRNLSEIGMFQRTRPLSSIVKHPTIADRFFVGEPSKFDNTTLIDNLRGGLVVATDDSKLFHLDGVVQGVSDAVGAVALLTVTGTAIAVSASAGPTGNGDDINSYTLVPAAGSLNVDLPGASSAVGLAVSSTHGYVAEYTDNSAVLGQLIVVDLSSGSTATVFTGVTAARAVATANFLAPVRVFVATTEAGVEWLRVYHQNALAPPLITSAKLPSRVNAITAIPHPTNATGVRLLVSMVDRFNIYDYVSASVPIQLVDSYRFSGGGQFFKSVVATNGNIVVAAGNAGVLVLNPTGKVRAQIQVSGKPVAEWKPNTVYALGALVKPRPQHQFVRNRLYFKVTSVGAGTGTSGADEPSWLTSGIVYDPILPPTAGNLNSLQWTSQGTMDGVALDVALDEANKRIIAVGVAGGDLGTDGRVWILGAGGLL